jgi:hypothetical protein
MMRDKYRDCYAFWRIFGHSGPSECLIDRRMAAIMRARWPQDVRRAAARSYVMRAREREGAAE